MPEKDQYQIPSFGDEDLGDDDNFGWAGMPDYPNSMDHDDEPEEGSEYGYKG